MAKTLCKLDQGDRDMAKRGRGSKRARFTCYKCDRKASKKKWLCKPIKKD